MAQHEIHNIWKNSSVVGDTQHEYISSLVCCDNLALSIKMFIKQNKSFKLSFLNAVGQWCSQGQSTMFVPLMSRDLERSASCERLGYSRCPANTNDLATLLL